MPALHTRADSLREYLSGALADGAAQTSPALSLGGFRSSSEAVSLGITVANALVGVSVLYAAGGNPVGVGMLTALDFNNMVWQPAGADAPGPLTFFNGVNDVEIVEGPQPGQYLRIQATTPLAPAVSQVSLEYLVNNLFGFNDVVIANASAGIIQYRASMIRNESGNLVSAMQRWIGTLGTLQHSDAGQLTASGAGTITTTGNFNDWPFKGWCQVRDSGGTLRELVYYSQRSGTVLSVPATGRGLLGTAAAGGSATDLLYPVPGIAIGIDPAGIQAFGGSIQALANDITAPAGVTWNLGISASTGLQIGDLLANQQVSVWMKRQIPMAAGATPQAITPISTTFNAM